MSGSNRPAVTCLSCGGRFRVTDPRWIGSIVPCPKCQGLVEIGAGDVDVDAKENATGALADTASEKKPSPDSSPLPKGSKSAKLDPTAKRSRPDHPSLGELEEGGISHPPAVVPPSDGPSFDLAVDPSLETPQDSATKPDENRSRRFAWLAGFGLAALLLIVALGLLFSKREPRDSAVASRQDPDVPLSDVGSPDGPTIPTDKPADDLARPDEEAGGTASGSQPPADQQANIGIGGSTLRNDETSAALPVVSPGGEGTTAGVNQNTTPSTESPSVSPTVEPASPGPDRSVKAEPAQAGGANIPSQGTPSSNGLDSASLDALPAGLRKFVPLMDESTSDIGPPQVFETPPTVTSTPMGPAAEDTGTDGAIGQKGGIDIPKAMSMRVAIQQQGLSLAELSLLISQLTTVPIELELISLDLAGVAVTQPCTTPTGWLTVDEWLNQTLRPMGLVAEAEAGRILVFASTAKLLEASGHAIVLDDFGDAAEAAAASIRRLVGWVGKSVAQGVQDNEDADRDPAEGEGDAKPGSDEPTAEDGWMYDVQQRRITLPDDRSAIVRSVLAAEAVRLSRGLPGKLRRWQTARWTGKWGIDRELGEPEVGQDPIADRSINDWPLVTGQPSGPTPPAPQNLAGFLRRMGRDHQVAPIVSWRDAARHEVAPADLVMPLMDGLAAGEVLDQVFGESGLQVRDCGGSLWWVGSEANYDRYEVITWIGIPEGTGEVVARRLATSMGLANSSQLNAFWDEQILVIRLPRYAARQLSRVAFR